MISCLLQILHEKTYQKTLDAQKQKFHLVLISTEPPNFMKMRKRYFSYSVTCLEYIKFSQESKSAIKFAKFSAV